MPIPNLRHPAPLPDTPEEPAIPSRDKRLDRMDRLSDMLHFPILVNAGATANILFTITVVYLLERWLPTSTLGVYAMPTLPTTPLLLTGLFVLLNVLPVIALRLSGWQRTAPMPTLAQMRFREDQHRFSSWVYLAASANMAFWILLTWCSLLFFPGAGTLALLLLLAFFVTFSPVLFRRLLP